jgi:hypothetical protein
MEAGSVMYGRESSEWHRALASVAEPRKHYGSGKTGDLDTPSTFAHLVSQIQQTDRGAISEGA